VRTHQPHGKAHAGFPARLLDGGVQGENIGLEGYFVNRLDDAWRTITAVGLDPALASRISRLRCGMPLHGTGHFLGAMYPIPPVWRFLRRHVPRFPLFAFPLGHAGHFLQRAAGFLN